MAVGLVVKTIFDKTLSETMHESVLATHRRVIHLWQPVLSGLALGGGD
jgi:hypothetical protein